jgi:hypothetical protein
MRKKKKGQIDGARPSNLEGGRDCSKREVDIMKYVSE